MAQQSPLIPQIWELQALAAEAIRATELVRTASAKIRDSAVVDPEFPDGFSCVVVQDGTKSKVIEDRDRGLGFCIVIDPILSGKPEDQSGPAVKVNSLLTVEIKVNVESNSDRSRGAQVDALKATVAVIKALCRKERHPGGEFFKLHDDGFVRSSFDPGLLSYIAAFSKEAVL